MALTETRTTSAIAGIDRRTILGVFLAALAALLVLLLTRPAPATPVLVAGGDLPVGIALDDLPLAVRHVTEADGLVAGDSVGELAGWSLAVPVAAGEPLTPSMLRPPALTSADALVSVPVERNHAVLGLLSRGDLVDVYVTVTGPLGETTTEQVGSRIPVVEVGTDGGSLSSTTVGLLLGVDADTAPRIVAAARRGDLSVVKRLP